MPPAEVGGASDPPEQVKTLPIDTEQLAAENLVMDDQLQQIVDNIDVAIWAKDVDNRFVYANQTCCDMILHCAKDEVLKATDTDFEENALANVCIRSDEVTKARRETCRFVEHSVYDGFELWLDVIKSPWFKDGVVIGTVGAGKDITDAIPVEIRNMVREPAFIDIPVDCYVVADYIEELVMTSANLKTC